MNCSATLGRPALIQICDETAAYGRRSELTY